MMIYKLAYCGFAIMYVICTMFDSNFKESWAKPISFLTICFVLAMQIAGIA